MTISIPLFTRFFATLSLAACFFVLTSCSGSGQSVAATDAANRTGDSQASGSTVPSGQIDGMSDRDGVYVRVNLVGYLPDDPKVAIVFADRPVESRARLVDPSGTVAGTFDLIPSDAPTWGRFAHYYEVDFGSVTVPGDYRLEIISTGDSSPVFRIGNDAYAGLQEKLLEFMRQQRCGYNPFLDMACHRQDARTAYGPLAPGTFIDVHGGWHDAGDQLKYMITSTFATGSMLLAYELEPDVFEDRVDAYGRDGSNDLPDVLDEANWGLDWLHRMHPTDDQLYHQIADDRDHIGWKWPNQDSSDYGWGPNSYRVVYFADGEPQGLGQFKSRATGVSNIAGRVAASMATAYRIYTDRGDSLRAGAALRKARSAYDLGRANEGFQQGNSFGAPYRYNEDTWADDMEWGAAELYRITGEARYLEDAKRYARMIGTTSWMPHDTTDHYRFYPFINFGHFALYPHVDEAFQDTLAGYYRAGIEATVERGKTNPFRIGVPFIWCSNNLATALITQIILYEKMTGDLQYHDFMIAQRDWLFGRNPWGTSMFTGIPEGGEFPLDVHLSVYALTRKVIPGGLVDGPVYGTIFRSLAGLTLTEPDEFAHLQNPFVVYHDDIGDYSTNEPTMDGTAGAIYMMAHFAAPSAR